MRTNDPLPIQIYFFVTYAINPLALVATPLLPSGLTYLWLFSVTVLPLFLSLIHVYVVKARSELGNIDHVSSRCLLLFHAATSSVSSVVTIFPRGLLRVVPAYLCVLFVTSTVYYPACWSAAGDSHALGFLGDLCLSLILHISGESHPQPSAGHDTGGPILPPHAPGTASGNQSTDSLAPPADAPGSSAHHDHAVSTHFPTRPSPAHLALRVTNSPEFLSQTAVSFILLRVTRYLFLGDFTGHMIMRFDQRSEECWHLPAPQAARQPLPFISIHSTQPANARIQPNARHMMSIMSHFYNYNRWSFSAGYLPLYLSILGEKHQSSESLPSK